LEGRTLEAYEVVKLFARTGHGETIAVHQYLRRTRTRVVVRGHGEAVRTGRTDGEQRARLEARGQKPSFADGQIAAIAATQGLVLVTRNTSDFEPFDGLELLNWFS
jgi:predicted nucleic acid-binding protein